MEKKYNDLIGIDIGRGYIKVIRATQDVGKLRIKDFSIKPTPSSKEGIGVALKNILNTLGGELSKVSFYTTIPGDKVSLRRARIPSVPKDEIDPMVKSTISRIVGYSPEEIKFDYYILGEETERGVKKLDILFIAVRNNTWKEYLNFFKSVEIIPLAVSPPAGNLLPLLPREEILSAVSIHIGYVITQITVVRKSTVMFTRNIPFGLKDLTDRLIEAKVPLAVVEKIMRQQKLNEEAVNTYPQIREVFRTETESLFKELHLTLSYYSKSIYKEKVEKCFLSGGGAKNYFLREALSKLWDLPIKILEHPEDKIILDLSSERSKEFEDNFHILSECLGCLLNQGHIGFPSFVKRKLLPIYNAPHLLAMYAVAGLLVILCAISYLAPAVSKFSYSRRLAKLKQQWQMLDELEQKKNPLLKKLNILKFKRNIVAELAKKNPSYSFAIAKIFESIPENQLFLQKLELYKQTGQVKLKLQGVSFDEQSPLRLMFNLENSGYFRKLSVNTQPRREASVKFKDILSQQQISGAVVFTIEGFLEKVESKG